MCTEKSRTEKKPAWEGDESLCSDGRSCEFFLKCWMTSGLLDGSCGGIMYACCQRKDAKAIAGDYNLIETPREQLLHPQLAKPDSTNFDHVSDNHRKLPIVCMQFIYYLFFTICMYTFG